MPGAIATAMIRDEGALFGPLHHATRAMMVVDVVESVRLVEQDEQGVIARWIGFVEHVASELLPAAGGHLVKSLGDGMLLEFPMVQAAVSAAFAIQHASHRGNLGRPPEEQMFLRVGIEIADVILHENDVYGRGVNRAARLATLAGPGEIVASAGVRDQLTPVLDGDIEDLGECYVKHLRTPLRAYRIGPPGPLPVIEPGIPITDLLPALAVIPFATRDLSDDSRVLGEVLAEELIRELSRSPELNVISRLSTTVFRAREASLAEISANLNANYVLSGEYSVNGNRVRMDVELAEAKSGRIVWTRRHNGAISSILSGRHDLIDRIVAEVSAAVISRELQRTQSQPVPTLKSYTLLLSAITLMHRLSPHDFEQARHLLDTLIERASRQAIPRAWLAKWHVLRVQQGWSSDPHEDARLALDSTRRALDTDPHCSLALAISGFVHTNLLKQLDVAQEHYEAALKINPNDSLAWLLRGTLHAFKGEGQQAVTYTQRALRLSPLDPHRYFYDSLAATAHLSSHQFDRALKLAKRSLKANRTHTSTLRAMAIAQWWLGLHTEARETVQGLLKLEPALTIRDYRERSPSTGFQTGSEWAEALRQAGVPD